MNNLSIPTVFKYTYGVNWGSWGESCGTGGGWGQYSGGYG